MPYSSRITSDRWSRCGVARLWIGLRDGLAHALFFVQDYFLILHKFDLLCKAAQKSFFNTDVLCKKFFNSAILGPAQCPPGGALPGTDGRPARGHTETIGQRMEPDLEALMPLPSVPYEACDRQPGRVSSLSLVRYKTNDCGRCSGGNSLLSAALPEARTKRSGSSLTSCRSCLVRLC